MTNKRRILLVDDEPRVVDGLQRYLRRYRDIWDVTTANSAHAALAKMETTVFDVIVTDMRMPQMDGATFLAIAKAMSPATMRIVLSGQTDPEAALRAVPVAPRSSSASRPTQQCSSSRSCGSPPATTRSPTPGSGLPSAVGRLAAERARHVSGAGPAARRRERLRPRNRTRRRRRARHRDQGAPARQLRLLPRVATHSRWSPRRSPIWARSS